GVLQYDVLAFRMKDEYGVTYTKKDLPHQYIKRLPDSVEPSSLKLAEETKRVQDIRGNNLLIFSGQWSMDFAREHNKGLELLDFDRDIF
ncbi:MAG: peptide chain release factor 3, partial [Clostridia bacterium]|nr:peptide chain release factor 3 [Clostridia bacterium]